MVVGKDLEGVGGDRIDLAGLQHQVARDVQNALPADIAASGVELGVTDALQGQRADINKLRRHDQAA